MKRLFWIAALSSMGCKGEHPQGVGRPAPAATPSVVASASAAPSANASAAPTKVEGPRFLARLLPDKSSASSEYRGKGEYRAAKRAFDGTRATAWNQADSPKGSKPTKPTTEWLEARFDTERAIRVLRIDTGYDDWSVQYGDLFVHNAHAKSLSISIDGGPPIVRPVAENERVATVRLPEGTKAKSVRVTFDELWPGDKWNDLSITEIGIFGEPAKVVDETAVDSAVKGIGEHYEDDSAGRGAALALLLGMPIPTDLVTEQRARVTAVWANLDGGGKDYQAISLTFRTRPNGERARRQVVMTGLLARIAPGKLALLASDTVTAQPDTEGFQNDTVVKAEPRLSSRERDDLSIAWQHTALDPSGLRVQETGLRVWSCLLGFPEPVFEQVFHRAEKTKAVGDFEKVTLAPREGRVDITVADTTTPFRWDEPSGIFAPR